MKFLVPNYSCLQNPWLGGYRPQIPVFCPQLNLLNPPQQNSWVSHCSALRFLGPEPALGVSRRDIQKRLGHWLVNQHWAAWRGLGDTQRQARELISVPGLGTRARFLTFNRTQSRVVTGLLTGHNTLRRHLYLLGLLDSPLCRKCRAREETSDHLLCECETLASLRHAFLGSFSLEPKDIMSLGLGATWNYSKVTGLPWFDMEHKRGHLLRPRCIGAERP